MEIIEINKNNVNSEHICCAIGNDKENIARSNTKKNWMLERFNEGLIFKRLNDRGKIFIEYMPIETVWKPLIGKNYFVINCLWVSGKFKGQGISTKLLDECIKDAVSLKKDGIAVVSSNKVKPFLTDKKFYIKKGFKVVDSFPPYFELLSLELSNKGEIPRFNTNLKAGNLALAPSGFSFVFSNQCPFTEEYLGLYAETAKQKGVKSELIKLESYQKAQEIGSPFGTLGIYFNRQFITHELMPMKKFDALLTEQLSKTNN